MSPHRLPLLHLRRAGPLLRPCRRADSLVLGRLRGARGGGSYIGFFVAPTDATQGESYRIIFIHVPAAWMSMLLYLVMAFWAAIGWAFNARLASMTARAIAPTGAMFTFSPSGPARSGASRPGAPGGSGTRG